jgi:hypothetical protein
MTAGTPGINVDAPNPRNWKIPPDARPGALCVALRAVWRAPRGRGRSVRFVHPARARVCTYRAHVHGLDVDADERAQGETFPAPLQWSCSATALSPVFCPEIPIEVAYVWEYPARSWPTP